MEDRVKAVVQLANQLVWAVRELVKDQPAHQYNGKAAVGDEVKALRAELKIVHDELQAARNLNQKLTARVLARGQRMTLRVDDVLRRRG